MKNFDIIIIGGGAAGLTAACAAGQFAKEKRINILLLEKNSRVGRKLLSTGNGRCNLSNEDIDISHFHSQSPELVEEILARRSKNDTLAFLRELGVRTVSEEGRIYPYSFSATSVLDALRLAADRYGVTTLTDFEVDTVSFDTGSESFTVKGTKDHFSAKKVILTTGGKAAPFSGSDGSGLLLASRFGHTVEALFPVLTPITVQHPAIKSLKGIRLSNIRLSFFANRKEIAAETGEILFTEYGFSGIPAMNASGTMHGHTPITGSIDMLPDMSLTETTTYLCERRVNFKNRPMEHFFTGFLHKRIGLALLKEAGIDPLTEVKWLSDAKRDRLAQLLKGWLFQITGVKGFASAQATGGGISLKEINPCDMQSRIQPGLFAAGEILDVYGDCGGYNLHWAWTTGFLSGYGAVNTKL